MIAPVVNPLRAVEIRRATAADGAVITRFFGALHAFNAELDARFALGDGWERVLAEHLAHEHAHQHGATFLALEADRPVGMVMMDGHTESPLFRHRHWAELVALWVEPGSRGRSVAEALVEEGVRWAGAQGYARVQLYVTASNHRARRFYNRSGFQPIQEIWCREIGHAEHVPPDDPACEAVYEHGHHLLSISPHHLTQVEEECPMQPADGAGRNEQAGAIRTSPRSAIEQGERSA